MSSVIVEAVLQDLEETALRISPPKFWARYVDDAFMIVRRDHVGALGECLNSIFPDVQSTMELHAAPQLVLRFATGDRRNYFRIW